MKSMPSFADVKNSDSCTDKGPRLAYLLSAYPAISHTFLLNEVLELRKRGFIIDVACINEPRWENSALSDTVERECETTFYVKQTRPAQVVLLLLRLVLTRPSVIFRGLLAVGQLGAIGGTATLYSMFYLAEALILGDWLRQRDHTHLHIHFGGPVATVGMLTSIAWNIPYSLSIHGPEEFYNTDKLHLHKKVERAAFVLCVSDHCRSQLMKLCEPVQWGKLHVARLGVDVGRFSPGEGWKTDDCLEIICVGRLVPDKGQLVLLHAFSQLLSRGHRLRLRLIGDGIERHRVEEFIMENGLSDSVIVEGALSHETTRMLLGRADIFVLASFAEGLPIALMEAMAMEIPCVSTYIAGIPELIRSEVDGLLVPASSEEALIGALDRLIANPELRRNLARSGRQRVVEQYDLQANVSTLGEIFVHQLDEACSNRPATYGVGRPRRLFHEERATRQQMISKEAMIGDSSQIPVE